MCLFVHWRLEPMCTVETPLVNGPSPIPDAQITASSVYDANFVTSNARLNSIRAWAPTYAELTAPIPSMFLQVSY